MTKTPWGPLGYITYKRTYSRRLKENDINSKTEEFTDTVERIIAACEKQLECGFTEEENDKLREYFLSLKGSVAGRFLWQLGTKTVEKLGLASLQNCAAVVVDHPIRPFVWAMDMLMLGSGVGYNIQKENVYQIPAVKNNKVKITRMDTNDANFIVPDSREGWCELLEKTLEAFFITGKSFTYSTVCIRGKGAPIKGFGGVASGPEELCWGIDQISQVLEKRRGKKIRPIDALDIMNIIGYVVVAGNVRRSAQIAIGDMDDIQFLTAKNWNIGNIPNWRAMSNNSVVCNDMSKLPAQFWDGYHGNGEPYGLVNLKLARSIGRTGETQYPDKNVMISNPCSEQFLESYETCVTGDTRIQTENGIFKIKDLVGKSVKVFNGEQWSTVTPFMTSPKQSFLKITLSDGSYLKTTRYHEFSVSLPGNKKVFKKLKAEELENGMYLPKFELPEVIGEYTDWAYTLGAFTGDGYLDAGYPMLCAVESLKDAIFDNCKIQSQSALWKSDESRQTMYRARIEKNSFSDDLWLNLRDSSVGLHDYIMSLDKTSSLAFLAGWIDTDGSIRNKGTKSEGYFIAGSESKIRDAQLLARRAGINFATVWRMNEAGEVTNYGTRNRDIWVLQIPSFECKEIPTKLKIATNFGSRLKHNNAHPDGNMIDTAIRQSIVSIEVLKEEEPSYCFNEPLKNMGVFGNCLTYQCCLAEVFLPNISSKEELKELTTLLYRICKHSLSLPCHHEETETVVHNNMRMGIGMTGLLQATEEQWSWLDETYTHLRNFDVEYSAKNKFPTSVKLTTVKPSGTLSLLPNVTPGIHPGFSKYFIRRIRIAANSPLIELCKEHGYQVECQKNFDGSDDRNTMVVSFPCKFSDNTIVAEEMTAIKQLEYVKKIQQLWSDNAVSCTVYYKKEELKEIQEWLLENYNNNLKAVSFLLHSEHGFVQAPYEEITRDQFNMMSFATRLISSGDIKDELDTSAECVGGACPVR